MNIKHLSRHQKNNLIIMGLLAIVAVMAIGYAAFSSQLRIDGTSNITSNFAVLITGIESQDVVGGATNKTEPTFTGTTATFNTDLTSPGDSITYKITVANQGTLDATLSSIDIENGNNDAIVFETSGIEEGDNLFKSTTDELFVKVTYSNSVTTQPENTNSQITVTLNYEQATGATVPDVPSVGGGASDTLIAQVVSDGDGLYADTYEEGRYVYKGANPNNYITFNDELWRIVSVEADGTIKIVRDELLATKAWDSTGGSYGSNNWARPADLNTYLNGEYYDGLTATAKGQITSHAWGIGAVTNDNNDLAQEIQDQNSEIWNGNIGLISSSDYLRANTNTAKCGTHMVNDDNYSTCKTTDWLFVAGRYYWTISPGASGSNDVFSVAGIGELYSDYANYNLYPRPAAYLKSDIQITGGEGTEISPYTLG